MEFLLPENINDDQGRASALLMVNLTLEVNVYVQHLKRCMRLKALADAKIVHACMLMNQDVPSIVLENTLIDVYAKCCSIADARHVFNGIKQPNLYSWTAIITAYTQHNQYDAAVGLFHSMLSTSVVPDKLLFMLIINACTNLASLHIGKLVHALVVENRVDADASVAKNLVKLYKEFGMIYDARKIFEACQNRDIVLWTAMVSGYVQHGLWCKALHLFQTMTTEGFEANEFTFVSVIKACGGIEALVSGMCMHTWILEGSVESNTHIANTLIDMYTKCRCMDDAYSVFDKMDNPDVISWTSIISGHTQCGLSREAIMLFERMETSGISANGITYSSALQACAGLQISKCGMRVHARIIRSGVCMEVCVHNSLIDMYCQCGYVQDARQTFDCMAYRELGTWTAIITCYVELGEGEEALLLFGHMQMEGVGADDVVCVSVLKACAAMGSLLQCKRFHAQIMESELPTKEILGSALIDMYAKCGHLHHASKAFSKLHEPDVISWTSLIAGFGEREFYKEALTLFEEMVGSSVQPNTVTYTTVLKVLGSLMDLERGRQLHSQILCFGLEQEVFVGSGLVDLYSKCRKLEDAQLVFDKLQNPDRVSWNALLTGYVQAGCMIGAFELLEKMHRVGLQPDSITSVALLKACVELEDLKLGRQVHGSIVERAFELDLFVASTLIDLYAKCGCLIDALVLFRRMRSPDLVSWNAILGGCAQQGQSKEAMELFEQMRKQSEVTPDIGTLGCVLAACSHGGLLEKGKHYFDLMTGDLGLTPLPWHCACVVDLFGRAGHLTNAKDFIGKLPIQPDAVVWMTMLGACRNHSNVTLGRDAFENVIKLDASNASAYILMSNIYSAAGMQTEAAYVRKEMERAGLKHQAWMEKQRSDGVEEISYLLHQYGKN